MPAGLVAMLGITGLGPKKVKKLHDELGLDSIEKLEAACQAGQVAALDGFGDKTQAICAKKIEYYYGDSDSDITAAVAAGAVPIRVKREKDSYSTDPHQDGLLGEAVLKDSEH